MAAFPTILLTLTLATADAAPGNETIRREDLRADLMFLAGDAFRGRLTATPENDLATDFVASRLERLGMKPVSGDSMIFRYNLVVARPGEHPASLEVSRGATSRRFAGGVDVYPLRFSANGNASGGVVFAGFGVVAPDLGRDDYRGIDLTGKVALVLDHDPGENDKDSPFDGLVNSEHADPLRKTLNAQQRGALAVLIVSDAHNHPASENFEAAAAGYWPEKVPRVDRFSLQAWFDRVHIPALQISRGAAEELLRGTGKSLAELGKAAENATEAAPLPLEGVQVSLSAEARRRLVPDRSVLAMIEGADPKLKDEYVIVSCHHDHDGADGAMILNGADDNGSGTVGLIEIAEAYADAAKAGAGPKRSVIFASFNSEERGLLGAWAFVEHRPVPLEKVVAVLNMDMVGRDEEVPENGGPKFRGLPVQTAHANRDTFTLLGHSRSQGLTSAIEKANREGGFGLTIKKEYDNNISNLIRRSDHWPFLQRGVPGVWFHTGLHPDYHTANDRPERVRYDKMERVVRLVHQASWDLANAPDRPRLDARKP